MLRNILKKKFSWMPKREYTKSTIFNFFGRGYLSKPVYNLSFELTSFLIDEKDYLENEFPFLKKEEDIYINFCNLHFLILYERFLKDKKTEEAQILEHYMKTECYTQIAQELNPHLDAEDFEDHFIELYFNRYQMIKNELLHILISSKDNHKKFENSLDRCILNLKFDVKMEKRNYLRSLSFHELNAYRINWGLMKERFQIEE